MLIARPLGHRLRERYQDPDAGRLPPESVASPFEGGLGGSAPLLVRFLGANEKMNNPFAPFRKGELPEAFYRFIIRI